MKTSRREKLLRVRQETAGSGTRSDAVESGIADCKAERSRDDVFRSLGGESLRYFFIIPLLFISLFGLVYYHGYLSFNPKVIEIKKIETRHTREVMILCPIGHKCVKYRQIPPAGADLYPKFNKGNHHLGVQRSH